MTSSGDKNHYNYRHFYTSSRVLHQTKIIDKVLISVISNNIQLLKDLPYAVELIYIIFAS